ncbi:MAG: protein kinase [Pyrinomonadaceae bacterium]|nr:protein kinase [Pyrinomonadaceae bacterium]
MRAQSPTVQQLSSMPIGEGTCLGRYEIRSLLGTGGMGEVYLAQDTQLDRVVALKILPLDLARDQLRMRRFIQEAKSASALNHPNIITIYEVGEVEDTHFIATEFVDGETLRQRIGQEKIGPDETLEIAIQVASALASAHDAGIIHRDIKPDNIMLRRDGYVKVLDFGLAKLTEKSNERLASEPEAMTLVNTEPGLVVGTVSYMSPEQARGLIVDTRSDIWSLGVVLYQMLTGHEPFEAATPTDQIVSIIERQPPPLSFYTENVPAEIERIILRALAKDRGDRYQTIVEMLNDMRQARNRLAFQTELKRSMSAGELKLAHITGDLSGRQAATPDASQTSVPTTARQPSSIGKRRRPRKKAIDSIAILPLINTGGDPNTEYLSDGITESIINSLSRLPRLRVMARSTVFRYKGKENDPREVGEELGVRAVLTGRLQLFGDRLMIGTELVDAFDGAQLWGEQYNRKLSDIFAVQDEIANEISEKLQLKLTGEEKRQLTKRYTHDTEAYHLYLKGRYFWNKRTHDCLERGLEFFKQAIEADATYALAYSGLADSYALLGVALPPRDAFPRAIAASLKALEIDDTVAEAHTSFAFPRMFFEWDWAGAEKEFKRAIELNPNYATAYQWYGRLLSALSRHNESIVNLQMAQALDPLSLSINTGVGVSYYMAGRYDEAIQQYRKALEMSSAFTVAHEHMGSALLKVGRHDEALEEFQAALRLDESDLGLRSSLGHAYAVTGRTEAAEAILSELIEASKQKYVSPYFMVEILAGLGRIDEAFEWLERCYTDRAPHLIFLNAERKLDTLRSDPRFDNLLKRMNLKK